MGVWNAYEREGRFVLMREGGEFPSQKSLPANSYASEVGGGFLGNHMTGRRGSRPQNSVLIFVNGPL